MNSLVYKDFRLSINWFFFTVMPIVMGALFLIPQWPYFIALMYLFFISAPNIFATYNAQNDFGFAIMMPVSKNEIVKGKILSFIIIELLHIFFGVIFATVHVKIYGAENFMLDLNPAFFGAAFIMYAIFNLVFFPGYFKSAYKYGVPIIAANTAAVIFAAVIETLVIINPVFSNLMEGTEPDVKLFQAAVLFGGIIIFTILSFMTYSLSAKRFEKIDL